MLNEAHSRNIVSGALSDTDNQVANDGEKTVLRVTSEMDRSIVCWLHYHPSQSADEDNRTNVSAVHNIGYLSSSMSARAVSF